MHLSTVQFLENWFRYKALELDSDPLSAEEVPVPVPVDSELDWADTPWLTIKIQANSLKLKPTCANLWCIIYVELDSFVWPILNVLLTLKYFVESLIIVTRV
jgi:hypothetical protein